MFEKWRMTAAVLVGFMVGCQQPPKTPPPSSLGSSDSSSAKRQANTYRSAHPGSEVGVVNAALPERHIVSIDGLPWARIKSGDVVTLMGSGGKPAVEAVVYDKQGGFTQARYQPLPKGQSDPAAGDMAVWFPASTKMPMSDLIPTTPMGDSLRSESTVPSTPDKRPPTEAMPKETSAPAPAAPSVATPAPVTPAPTEAAAPATAPAPTSAPAATEPATTVTPVATMPASRPAIEFNK